MNKLLSYLTISTILFIYESNAVTLYCDYTTTGTLSFSTPSELHTFIPTTGYPYVVFTTCNDYTTADTKISVTQQGSAITRTCSGGTGTYCYNYNCNKGSQYAQYYYGALSTSTNYNIVVGVDNSNYGNYYLRVYCGSTYSSLNSQLSNLVDISAAAQIIGLAVGWFIFVMYLLICCCPCITGACIYLCYYQSQKNNNRYRHQQQPQQVIVTTQQPMQQGTMQPVIITNQPPMQQQPMQTMQMQPMQQQPMQMQQQQPQQNFNEGNNF